MQTNEELLDEYLSMPSSPKRAELRKAILDRMIPSGENVIVFHGVSVCDGDLAGQIEDASIEEIRAELDARSEYQVREEKYIEGDLSGPIRLDGIDWGEYNNVSFDTWNDFVRAVTKK